MRARYSIKPEPVTVVTDGNIVYFQIALNPVKVTINDDETERTEWECDFNQWHCYKSDIDIEDVRENPSNYLDYEPEAVSDSEQRIRDIENALVELGDLIGG